MNLYKEMVTLPRWDTTYTDPALLISNNDREFTRDNGKGLFPRAYATVAVPDDSVRWLKLFFRDGTAEVTRFHSLTRSLMFFF